MRRCGARDPARSKMLPRRHEEHLATDDMDSELSILHILVKHAHSARLSSWRDPQGLRIPSRTIEQAQTVLRELREQLEQHTREDRAARFAELAHEISDCGTAREGGNFGRLNMDEFEDDFAAAITGLSLWELSEIVETDSGSHLIMRIPANYNVLQPKIPPDPPNTVSDSIGGLDGATTSLLRSSSVGKPSRASDKKTHREQSYRPNTIPNHLGRLKSGTMRNTEDEHLRHLFDKADTDGSGTLQLKEIKRLCKELGDRMSNIALEEGFYRMDPEKTGKVDFETFRKWWKQKQDTARREMRKNVQEIFR